MELSCPLDHQIWSFSFFLGMGWGWLPKGQRQCNNPSLISCSSAEDHSRTHQPHMHCGLQCRQTGQMHCCECPPSQTKWTVYNCGCRYVILRHLNVMNCCDASFAFSQFISSIMKLVNDDSWVATTFHKSENLCKQNSGPKCLRSHSSLNDWSYEL